jgi:hypothetical protein
MMLTAKNLSALPGIRHAFFTREGGVSEGLYASLNAGYGSHDDLANIDENRARMAKALGVTPANPASPSASPPPTAARCCSRTRRRALSGPPMPAGAVRCQVCWNRR